MRFPASLDSPERLWQVRPELRPRFRTWPAYVAHELSLCQYADDCVAPRCGARRRVRGPRRFCFARLAWFALLLNRDSPDERPTWPPRRQYSRRTWRSAKVISPGKWLGPCRLVGDRCVSESL